MDANPSDLIPHIQIIDNKVKDRKKFHIIGRREECILISAILPCQGGNRSLSFMIGSHLNQRLSYSVVQAAHYTTLCELT